MQRFPICAQRSNDALVPNYLSFFEEVQVDSAPLEVDGVHGLGAASLNVQSLLLWCSGQLPASDHKTLLSSVLDEFAGIQQESGLLL